MPYRVFLSTNHESYLSVAKTALWNMNEFAISAVSAVDMASGASERMLLAKQAMETTQLFMGIYGAGYGDVPAGATQSYAEQEYHLAMQRGIMCVVLMDEACKTTQDERALRFIQHLTEHHVIVYFSDEQDLSAKIIVTVDNFRANNRAMRLRPPMQTFLPTSMLSVGLQEDTVGDIPDGLFDKEVADEQKSVAERKEQPERGFFRPSPPPPSPTMAAPAPAPAPQAIPPAPTPKPLDMATLVEQALAVASDDIEQIMRRALQVHDAQKQVTTNTHADGWMRINPIFGQPNQASQFQSDVFMIMPFREAYQGVYQNIIRPVVGSLNLTIKRGDDFASLQGSIMAEVWAALNACKLVIVETTEVNANVYYELGIAHTLGKPAILLTQNKEVEQIPFDIRHLRFIVYENTIQGGEKLEQELRKTIIWLMNDLGEMI